MIKKKVVGALSALVAVFSTLPVTAPAVAVPVYSVQFAAADSNRPLDPDTFAGPMIVATPSGDVLVTVGAGEAAAVAEQVRQDVSDGNIAVGRPDAVLAKCNAPIDSWASPFGYSTSVNGCAVFGYTGYIRTYSWENGSDVNICTKGNGYNSNTAQVWYSTGCLTGGDSTAQGVPWGNVLAYTKMQGYSLSGVTGAYYTWIA